MRFAILGPLEVSRNGAAVPIGGPQQRAVLAVLLLDPGRVVSVDRLIEHLWGDEPPAAARSLVQGCVAALRRALRAAAGAEAEAHLVTRPPGYLLRVAPGELDVAEFDERVTRAAELGRQPSTQTLTEASGLLHEALALWRGPALDGVAVTGCEAGIVKLAERRLAAIEERIDVDLLLGRHSVLVGELRALVSEHPLRERLWAQLMVALAGCDRQADALSAYQELRRTLVETLGVEPAASVQRLHRAILTGADPLATHLPDRPRPAPGSGAAPGPAPNAWPGPAPAAGAAPASGPPAVTADEPTPRAVPAQLPPGVASFTGRADLVDSLDRILAETAGEHIGIAVLAGAPGVGKTALALHWAHGVRDQFPDGALYVNLRGYASGPPLRPVDALAGFVQALGVAPEKMPADADAAAALYRSLLAGRRVIVVLDNANTADQVRPLLPGGPGCLVLVTSRDRMRGLVVRDGAHRLDVPELRPDEARELLVRLLGADRVAAAPAAAAHLAGACGRLPLAMRIAAATLADAPWRGLADYVRDLVAGNRLDAFTVTEDGDYGVRSAFDLSYTGLAEPVRRLFRVLGLAPGPDVGQDGAAALLGAAPEQVAPLLDRLVGAHLVGRSSTGGAGRFVLHDLLRLYAVERGEAEDPAADRAAATERLHAWYLHSADAAARVLGPEKLRLAVPAPPAGTRPVGFDGPVEALAWLDTERHNLRATVQAAAGADHAEPTAWLLSDALRGYYSHRMYTVDWVVVAGAAAIAAAHLGDLHGQAAALLSLADADSRRSRYASAIENYRAALALMTEAGWERGQAAVLGNLGVACRQAGRLDAAEDYFARALALNAEIEWVAGTAANLVVLGRVLLERGRYRDAEARHVEALALFRSLGSRYGEAIALGVLGETCRRLGRRADAIEHLTAAVALCRSVGDRGSEGDALRELACVHLEMGRTERAEVMAHRAVELARESTDGRTLADALNALAAVHHTLGRMEPATNTYREALRVARRYRTGPPEVAALIGLASVHDDGADPTPAAALLDEALDLARRCGYHVLADQAVALRPFTQGEARRP